MKVELSRNMKYCSEEKLIKRKHGKLASRIMHRFEQLSAFSSLLDFHNLPGVHCHELKHDRKGYIALSISGNFRLIIEPRNEPLPIKPDGGLDWSSVTHVLVVAIEDYH